MQAYLTWRQVLKRINRALVQEKPFSLVRVGDGENICLAQSSVWPMRAVLKEPWAMKANRGEKGVNLPNIRLRNQLVWGIKNATIVGILPRNDKRIHAPRKLKRPLTDKVFAHFGLAPRWTCDACLNRYLPDRPEFWELLKKRRVLLITKHTVAMKQALTRKYGIQVAGTIYFSHYRQLSRTLRQATAMKHRFDVALITAGVNAVILAPKIAHATGKVAIDFGKAYRKITSRRRLKVKLKHSETKDDVTGQDGMNEQMMFW